MKVDRSCYNSLFSTRPLMGLSCPLGLSSSICKGLRLFALLFLLADASGSAMAMCNGDPDLVPRSLFDRTCVHPPCGRDGDAACTFFVRVPSCDRTLAESAGSCVQCGGAGELACPFTVQVPSCDASLAESGGRCVQCGGEGQVACPVTVRMPSCDPDLVESNGICVVPPCGHEGEIACPVTVRIPSCYPTLAESGGRCVQCGGLGEVACPFTVQVPSCDASLAESGGRCVQCGGVGQVACPVTVRVPSCNPNLAEANGMCEHCGARGEIACPVSVKVPSCNPQLMEDPKGRCITVAYAYGGGDVVSNPEIVVVYWGTQPTGLENRLNRFYSQIVSSSYFNALGEYDTPTKKIGTPKFIGSFRIKQGSRSKPVDTIRISREIDKQILAGRLPRPNDSTIYVVHFGRATPPAMGTNILGETVGASVGDGFCAYHITARTQVPAIAPLVDIYGPKIRIAVIPEASTVRGCGHGSVLDTATFSATHEMVETITNPDSVVVGMFPVAGETLRCDRVVLPPVSGLLNNAIWSWVSRRSIICNPDEIADQCGAATLRTSSSSLDSYNVSQIWSNSVGSCSSP